MFGESDSESPRVPSPWDSLISSSPDPAPSPVHIALPRLVPENDSGNVEYKLQLLSPSPARFARLVTQLKWRLLEGGGQAYYELGVADSGVLVGLSRSEMEATLETLEMMAGEIGASVVVVKEIEVPEAMVQAVQAQQVAGILLGEDKWFRTKRRCRRKDAGDEDETTTTDATAATETTTGTTDVEEEEDLSATVMAYKPLITVSSKTCDNHNHTPIFVMDPEPEQDPADNADCEQEREPDFIPSIVIDIEIFSVFKPRPVRTRVHSAHLMNQAARNKRQKKQYKPPFHQGETQGEEGKKSGRHKRQFRDKKRTLQPPPPLAGSDSGSSSGSYSNCVSPSPSPSALSIEPPTVALAMVKETDALVSDLEGLHVSVVEIDEDMMGAAAFTMPPTPAVTPASTQAVPEPGSESEPFVIVCGNDTAKEARNNGSEDDDDDDVFPTPSIPATKSSAGSLSEQNNVRDKGDRVGKDDGKRIIVEALVVRKMSLEEAFLDFGTFA